MVLIAHYMVFDYVVLVIAIANTVGRLQLLSVSFVRTFHEGFVGVAGFVVVDRWVSV